jgi:hypothetical protein
MIGPDGFFANDLVPDFAASGLTGFELRGAWLTV